MCNAKKHDVINQRGMMQGHSEELWAIAGHPTEPEFVTAGYDQMVMLWHSDTHRLLWKTLVEVTDPAIS